MSLKKFRDVVVGEVFTWQGVQYQKIADERVSCCRVNNAVMVSDPTKKTSINQVLEVEVND